MRRHDRYHAVGQSRKQQHPPCTQPQRSWCSIDKHTLQRICLLMGVGMCGRKHYLTHGHGQDENAGVSLDLYYTMVECLVHSCARLARFLTVIPLYTCVLWSIPNMTQVLTVVHSCVGSRGARSTSRVPPLTSRCSYHRSQ